ncbi:hypothetical protein J6O48_09615 [bacterium]|nr:hypothetical protein [bacterium]
MKNILTNYRYYVLFVISLLTALLAFCAPSYDKELSQFVTYLVITKIAAVLFGYILVRLINKWYEENRIPELIQFLDSDY